MSAEVIARITAFLLDEGSPGYPHEGPPPGSPPTQKFEGPWFSTQLILSLGIGVSSFLTFCFLRTRWDVVYMGRTKLKDFSPTPAHSPDVQAHGGRLFSWIIPTLRTSEYTVLQTVGLDAAVLLNFYRMAFLLFSTLALLATVILMPLNYFRHGSTDSDVPDTTPGNDTDILNYNMFSHKHRADIPSNHTSPPTLYDILLDPQTSAAVNLIFAYIFTALVLTFLHKNFHRFVQSRQTFALHLIHSISTRTVLVTNLPTHLRGDRALANYFEGCGWTVESVSVVREVEPLRRKLEKRTNALLRLENAWVDWVGNPAKGVKGYDPNIYNEQRGKGKNISQATDLTESPSGGNDDTPLIPDLDEPSASSSRAESRSQTPGTGRSGRSDTPGWGDLLDAPDSGSNGASEQNGEEPQSKVQTSRPRPQYRPRWFGNKVDAIEFWEKKFRAADAEVREMRRNAQFDSTHVAFVTFEDVKEAQMACQVVHYPKHSEVVTELAPEPRDIVWSNISISARQGWLRTIAARIVYLLLLLFWIPPVSTLATLLSYEEIKRILPWLARIIERSPRLNSIITNSFTSLALIVFNGILPFFLSWLSYEQGYKSRSGTEYSLMRKYHLALLISVLFIFLLTTTIWAVIRDLADTPAKVPEKLASALLKSNAKNFMVSYVMLQGLGLMPLQLLNLGPLFTLGWARSLYTSTPRDFAEAYAPPMLNYGWVYPQALLVFTITLVFSVVSPFILPFGALYFGVAYLVYKYKLLFIYFKPYESNGEAWRITFTRLLWAVVIFQLFMTGLFTLRKLFWPSVAMVPLIGYTLWWAWMTSRDFGPLSEFLALSSICEVERGEGAEQVVGVAAEGQVTRSQSNLNHRRYAVNDETLYVAPSDKRTDYSQPPMSSFYYGVLNTGRRRYAHPALSGSLPFPWLPAKATARRFGDGAAERRGVVLSLRRKMAKKLKRSQDNSAEGEEPRRSASSPMPDGWMTGDSYRDGASGDGGGGLGVPEAEGGSSGERMSASQLSTSSNPWGDPTPSQTRMGMGMNRKTSYDPVSGIIALPEDNVWGDEGSSEDEERDHGPASPSTYFHHPERRRTVSGSNNSQGDGTDRQSSGRI